MDGMVKGIDRDFSIGERVTCAKYPLHSGGFKRMPVIVSAIHYNDNDEVIALSVFGVPLIDRKHGQYLKDLRVNEGHYDFENASLSPHFIDTGTKTTLEISCFDTDRDYIATLKPEYLPDLMLRRLYAELRHVNTKDRDRINMELVEYSETLFRNSRMDKDVLDHIIETAGTYISKTRKIQWPKLGTFETSPEWLTTKRSPAVRPRP